MTDTKGTGSELAVAAIVNVVVYRTLFSALSLPGWWGGMVAAASMAVASDPSAGERARQLAGGLSSPGAIAVQAFRNSKLTQAACCAPCAAGTECEADNANSERSPPSG